MEKWVRRSVQAALAAGAVGVASVGAAQADDAAVASGTVSETVSIAAGTVAANTVAVTGIGAAINGEEASISGGVLGSAQACQSGVANTGMSLAARSSSTSAAVDDHVRSEGSISASVAAPVTFSDAVVGIGAAANAEDLTAALGILGEARAGDCDKVGNGDIGNGRYRGAGAASLAGVPAGQSASATAQLSDASLHSAVDAAGAAADVESDPAVVVGGDSAGSGNSVSAAVTAQVTGSVAAGAGVDGAVNAAGDVNVAADAQADAGVEASGSTGDAAGAAADVESDSAVVVGGDSAGSNNSLSAAVTAQVTGNAAAGAGVDGAVNAEVNAEDVSITGSLLGSASARLGG